MNKCTVHLLISELKFVWGKIVFNFSTMKTNNCSQFFQKYRQYLVLILLLLYTKWQNNYKKYLNELCYDLLPPLFPQRERQREWRKRRVEDAQTAKILHNVLPPCECKAEKNRQLSGFSIAVVTCCRTSTEVSSVLGYSMPYLFKVSR